MWFGGTRWHNYVVIKANLIEKLSSVYIRLDGPQAKPSFKSEVFSRAHFGSERLKLCKIHLRRTTSEPLPRGTAAGQNFICWRLAIGLHTCSILKNSWAVCISEGPIVLAMSGCCCSVLLVDPADFVIEHLNHTTLELTPSLTISWSRPCENLRSGALWPCTCPLLG